MLPLTELLVMIPPVVDVPLTAFPCTRPLSKDDPLPPEALAASTLMLVLPRACSLLSSAVGTALPANTLMMLRAPAPVFSPARHDPSKPAAAASRAAIAKMADVFMFHPLSFAERRGPHRPQNKGDADSSTTCDYGGEIVALGLNPLNPPPLLPTIEVSATEFCCTALAPVFRLACKMPWPPIESVIVTVPLLPADTAA
jgi:hypothetical protein